MDSGSVKYMGTEQPPARGGAGGCLVGGSLPVASHGTVEPCAGTPEHDPLKLSPLVRPVASLADDL